MGRKPATVVEDEAVFDEMALTSQRERSANARCMKLSGSSVMCRTDLECEILIETTGAVGC